MIIEAALICLAQNIFYEARSESVVGQYAVAQVTMRRAEGKPRNVCKVVHAPRQFSWTNQRQGNPAKIDPDAYDRAKKIARVVLRRRIALDFSKGADFYHARYVSPRWAKSFKRTAVVGRHIFYKGQSQS